MNIASLLSGMALPDVDIRSKVSQKQESGFLETLTKNMTGSELKETLLTFESEETSDLVSLLDNLSSEEKEILLEWVDQLVTDIDLDELIDLDSISESEFTNLIAPYVDDIMTSSETELDLEGLSKEQRSIVSDLSELYDTDEDESQIVLSQLFVPLASDVNFEEIDESKLDRIHDKVEDMQAIMDDFSTDDKQGAKELLAIMKQLYTEESATPSMIEQVMSKQPNADQSIDLGKIYEKFHQKMSLHNKTAYKTDTTVTGSDVLKWIKNAVSNQMSAEENSQSFGQLFNQQQTHAPLEQLSVHLSGNTESVDSMAEELLAKFEQAMAQSKLSFGKTGSNQLMLRLTPESLGNVLVEMTEIDGEMMVKLTASSQLAKEALEANMKELRHMFSPHNVTVEKQEPETLTVDQQSNSQQTNEEEQTDQNREQSILEDQSSEDEQEETISFSELLQEEGV
ncbi:Flagellar hook-length control protein FliK [Pelagirhabdus alkalitolerans]|uniref:Flagellar hook-length control protein FliK n=1 Tax=Pelagirhabdus alkalitolerans TaxID=1612202 RepID=A0A1G6H3A0_9BACI|nr:flagellar hook-length control protein FliK [Pelagirhabdus alkalitolerans]SDB88671.1 Flagellar hook-length control protein FliK [Pelagirhabdus alkalitolerans]